MLSIKKGIQNETSCIHSKHHCELVYSPQSLILSSVFWNGSSMMNGFHPWPEMDWATWVCRKYPCAGVITGRRPGKCDLDSEFWDLNWFQSIWITPQNTLKHLSAKACDNPFESTHFAFLPPCFFKSRLKELEDFALVL